MEFIDEEYRPRFQMQSRPPSSSSSSSSSSSKLQYIPPTKLHIVSCFLFSFLLLFLSFRFFSDSQTLTFFLVWFSLSFLLAPFTPSSLTSGDPTVGAGPTLPDPIPETLSDPDTDRLPRRSRARKADYSTTVPIPQPSTIPNADLKAERSEKEAEGGLIKEEKEWSEKDYEILKKQVSKHPVGEPGRWEKIAEAFEGRFKVESIIKIGKSMGERKVGDSDSFARFLKDRKPVDKRVESEIENGRNMNWSSNEDIALLNALKVFPKDVDMRWDKVAAAVPGRTKAECVKRVAELKKDFRSSK